MLTEEQAAELLRRCELLAGKELRHIRQLLRNAKSRASAVFELLTLEAAAQLGRVETEAEGGGPDIRLEMPSGRWVWIECAYLYPRFGSEERQSRVVEKWIEEQREKLGPNPPRIGCSFYGNPKNPAGPVRVLPQEQNKKLFFLEPEVAAFFKKCKDFPDLHHQVTLKSYSVTLAAAPHDSQTHVGTGGGLVQEVPRVVKEHAAYRILEKKRKQHDVDGPRLVCMGGHYNHPLSDFPSAHSVKLGDAIGAAFNRTQALSGALVVNLKTEFVFGSMTTYASAAKCSNANARNPLSNDEWEFISRFDFNRWKYIGQLPSVEEPTAKNRRAVSGPLKVSNGITMTKLTIPVNVLIDALAGRSSVAASYQMLAGDEAINGLAAGWTVKGCKMIEGDVQRGLAPSIEFDLVPPHDDVYWQRTK